MESVLLLFDENHPCWTRDLVEKAGEDPRSLDLLREQGDLQVEEGIFTLTSQGVASYRRAAQESFYDVPPGEICTDPARCVLRTELEQLLDRGFWGRWGIKEFRAGIKLPYLPGLTGSDLFEPDHDGEPRWTFLDHEAVRAFQDRYPAPVSPDAPPPGLQEFEAWRKEKGLSWGSAELDLLFLHHYDTEHFKHLPPQPNDRLGFFHTDHFYFQLLPEGIPPVERFWEELGPIHLFMMNQRRVFLPWFFDFDTTGYDAVNWWFWVTPGERELSLLKDVLQPVAEALVRPSLPFELFGISLETLRQVKEKREYHWDLFEQIAIPLSPRL